MRALARFVRLANGVSDWVGRTVSWFTFGTVALCFAVVMLRYVFHVGAVWMQDAYVWLHAAAFTIGAGYTLRRERHVRVDILYRHRGERYRAWVDLLGVLGLLLPFVVVLTLWGWDYVLRSWHLGERSANVGGMPGLYLLKSCVIGFAWLVGLQGLALAATSVLVLAGRCDLLAPSDRVAET